MRKILDLTQQDFADRLGTTRNNIAGYEIGRRSPSVAVISLICREFNVSEAWLRTGEGEMFIQPQNRKDEIQRMVERMMEGRKAEFKYRLISVLNTLDEDQWESLERYLRKIVDTRDDATDRAKQEQAQSDVTAELAELKRQSQELAARMAAVEEEDASLGLTDVSSKSPSVSVGNFSSTQGVKK